MADHKSSTFCCNQGCFRWCSELFYLRTTDHGTGSDFYCSAFAFNCNKVRILLICSVCFYRFIRPSIEGQVIRKSEICKFSNGTGKFFTFDVADLHSEIRCKAFNDIIDIFFEVIVVGQVSDVNYCSLIFKFNFIGLSYC